MHFLLLLPGDPNWIPVLLDPWITDTSRVIQSQEWHRRRCERRDSPPLHSDVLWVKTHSHSFQDYLCSGEAPLLLLLLPLQRRSVLPGGLISRVNSAGSALQTLRGSKHRGTDGGCRVKEALKTRDAVSKDCNRQLFGNVVVEQKDLHSRSPGSTGIQKLILTLSQFPS